jgi:hypothetical protein
LFIVSFLYYHVLATGGTLDIPDKHENVEEQHIGRLEGIDRLTTRSYRAQYRGEFEALTKGLGNSFRRMVLVDEVDAPPQRGAQEGEKK